MSSKEHGDYFGICVAGYPEAHPEVIVDDAEQMDKNYWSDIRYLKEKVRMGGGAGAASGCLAGLAGFGWASIWLARYWLWMDVCEEGPGRAGA